MPLVALNKASLDLIKSFEGLRLNAYPDPATGGEPWTIGYGHTSAAGLPKVMKGLKISAEEAEAILALDLGKFADQVFHRVTLPLNPNQFGAVVSLAYNIGLGNFGKSTLLKRVNAGEFELAAKEFARWNKANKKVMDGLTRRRAAEAKLFLTPPSTWSDDTMRTHSEPAKPENAIPAPPPKSPGLWSALLAIIKFLLSLLAKKDPSP